MIEVFDSEGMSQQTDVPMSQQVFAFGSNMCSGRFRAYGVVPEGAVRPALLVGYRLVFNKRSTEDKSGKANLEPHEGSDVWGVLYTVSDADLSKLDEGEGGYQRVELRVKASDDTPSAAWVYLAKRPDNTHGLRPYTWYKRFLVEGAREHSLPAAYTEHLERVEAIEDTDTIRDKLKRSLTCQDE